MGVRVIVGVPVAVGVRVAVGIIVGGRTISLSSTRTHRESTGISLKNGSALTLEWFTIRLMMPSSVPSSIALTVTVCGNVQVVVPNATNEGATVEFFGIRQGNRYRCRGGA